jgi:hypothetical protein
MVRRISFLLHRAAHGLAAAVCIGLLACGGGGDATAPDPNPPQHDPAPDPNPPDQPPPPNEGIVGTYGLVVVNDSKPGQMVLLSNPDGGAIGLYRFDASTTLSLTALGTYTVSMKLQDDKDNYEIYDEGEFKWSANGNLISLTFESARDGRKYPGMGSPAEAAVAIKYDMDGDGNPDTVLGFERVGG